MALWWYPRDSFVNQDMRAAIANGLAGLAVVGGTVTGLRVGGTAKREGQQDTVTRTCPNHQHHYHHQSLTPLFTIVCCC
jgi:hypothetical protein